MHTASRNTSASSLLASLLIVAACLSSTGAAANVPPELTKGMVQMSANLNHAAVACGDMSASKVESLREQQRAEFLKTTPTLSGADYDRMYAEASKEFQAKWTSLSATQKKDTCARMKQLSNQGNEALKSMPK